MYVRERERERARARVRVCVFVGVCLRVGERSLAFVNLDRLLWACAQPCTIIRLQAPCTFY